MVEFHRLEFLRIKTGMSHHLDCTCALVDTAEITREAHTVELTFQAASQGEEPAVERGDFHRIPIITVYGVKSRYGVIDSRHGIQRGCRYII